MNKQQNLIPSVRKLNFIQRRERIVTTTTVEKGDTQVLVTESDSKVVEYGFKHFVLGFAQKVYYCVIKWGLSRTTLDDFDKTEDDTKFITK